MRTRLKDVANKLQLSPALVSGVLNQRPNVWASEETRARILEAARQMNYQPSAAAQALSKGRTATVCLVYRRLEGFSYRLAYSGVVDALSDDLQSSDFALTVANFAEQEAVLEHLRRLAGARACDAVILWGREQDTEAQGELLERLNMPFLVKGRHEVRHPHWHQVDFDHEAMIGGVVDHLVDLGHRRLAYLGFAHDDEFVSALRRGFVQGHLRHFGTAPRVEFIAAHEDNVGPNEATIRAWLALPEEERPTGFVVGSGNAAWHALETCLAQIGHRLEIGGDGFAASGITSLFFTLMFGEAYVYQGIEVDNLAHAVSPGLLKAILSGEDVEPIQRFLPSLSLAPTLDLLRHGVTFSGEAP